MELGRKNTRVAARALVLASVVVLAAAAVTGGLAPGATPLSATQGPDPADPRTPISALPFTITESGSYYLTASLTLAGPDQNGIEVDANNVTIDLMGHSLTDGGGNGISIAGKSNVEIRNGTVAGWGGDGIHEKGGTGHRIVGVRAVRNDGSGIFLSGVAHVVKDCTATQNGWYGLAVADASTLDRNTVYGNYSGIYAGDGCAVTNNTLEGNWAAGILVQSGCAVTSNTSDNNQWPNVLPAPTDIDTSTGLVVYGSGNTIRGNTLRGNPNTNIRIKGTHNAIEDNLVTDSQTGIYFGAIGNFYANNRASQNTTNYSKAPSSNSPGDGGGNATF